MFFAPILGSRQLRQSQRADGKFACLTYHIVGSEGNQYTVREDQLGQHLALLGRAGYVGEGFEQLDQRLYRTKVNPKQFVLLTFDDGHESAMKAADLLEHYGAQATFFVTRDRAATKVGYLRAFQLRALRRRGFSLGTHGTTHRKLTFMPENECIRELSDSKKWLEDVLGEAVRYMAAPGGFISPQVTARAVELGYTLVGTSREAMNSFRLLAPPCEINRLNVRSSFGNRMLSRAFNGDTTFYLWRRIRAATLFVPKQLLR